MSEVVKSALHARCRLGRLPSGLNFLGRYRRINRFHVRLAIVSGEPVVLGREDKMLRLPVGEIGRPHLKLERQEQEPSALRAGADNGETRRAPVPVRHIEIARTVLKDSPNAEIEYLVDAFHSRCLSSKIEATRTEAIAALTTAR